MINYSNSSDVVAQLTCKNKKQFSCYLEMPPRIFILFFAKMRYRLKVVGKENNHAVSWDDGHCEPNVHYSTDNWPGMFW